MEKIKLFLLKNWKTTLGGLLVFILTILKGSDLITTEVFISILGLLTALGFIAAKDGDKTGV